MIHPRELMVLAEWLAARPGEPEGRAAVSRAYYAAFHVARMLVEEGCGIILPGGPEVHKKLQFCLEQSQDAALMKIADRLQSLRDQRNRADYKLTDSKFASPANVQGQLKSARDIIAELNAMAPRVADFRAAVRAYASNVLKLRLKTV
jgi:hypothetical protein